MMSFDEAKTIALVAYLRETKVPLLTEVKQISNTDGTFLQLGIRPQFSVSMFNQNESCEYLFRSLGERIANGELNYFVTSILDKVKSNNIGEFSPIEFVKIATKFKGNSRILLSFYHIAHLLAEKFVSYAENKKDFVLSYAGKSIPVYAVSDKILNNCAIIYETEAVIWKQKIFDKYPIDIQLKPINGTVDATLRVLVKQELKPSSIEVLNFDPK